MEKEHLFSECLIYLLKGIVNSQTHEKIWYGILENKGQIEEYFSKIGLILILQKQEGYAYLKQAPQDQEMDLPKLSTKRQLNFLMSFILLLLRKKWIEFKKESHETKCVISHQDIVEKMSSLIQNKYDEVKQKNEITANIKKVEGLGFLRSLNNSHMEYEISPLVSSFVDTQCIQGIEEKMKEYLEYAKSK